jgi:hypothetical protein
MPTFGARFALLPAQAAAPSAAMSKAEARASRVTHLRSRLAVVARAGPINGCIGLSLSKGLRVARNAPVHVPPYPEDRQFLRASPVKKL